VGSEIGVTVSRKKVRGFQVPLAKFVEAVETSSRRSSTADIERS
jgi:hypothetical protein